MWNNYLLKPLRKSNVSSQWILPVIHGYFNQTSTSPPLFSLPSFAFVIPLSLSLFLWTCLVLTLAVAVACAEYSVFGRTVSLTLLSRRSRYFAGARFLKRGVTEDGKVANDVESEQILHEARTPTFHSSSSPRFRLGVRRLIIIIEKTCSPPPPTRPCR